MNICKICPDIPDGWKGSVTDVCHLLGDSKPISQKTVRKYLRLGGINPRRGTNGRLQITGKEVKLIWRMI